MSCPVIPGIDLIVSTAPEPDFPLCCCDKQHMELQVLFIIWSSVVVALGPSFVTVACKCMTSSAHNSRRQPCTEQQTD